MRRSRAIKELKAQLERDQALLDTSILVSLRQTARQAVELHHRLSDRLGESTAAIIQSLAFGHCSVRSLIESQGEKILAKVREEGVATRDHITQKFHALEIKSPTEDQRRELLESLHFPDLNLRQEQVPDAHVDTFEFLFDEDNPKMESWLRFLHSDGGLFWLSGKAGSGKTVAMNLIAEDDRTTQLLFCKFPDRAEPLIITFFAWNAGSALQNSTVGLLRSLLYELLESEAGIVDLIFQRDQTLSKRRTGEAWSEKRLKQLLRLVVSSLRRPLFVLVDGVDEVQRGRTLLSKSFELINTVANAKTYRLEVNSAYKSLLEKKRFTSDVDDSDLVENILTKAYGVFLWVKLAVDQILEVIGNLDDWNMLLQRLEEIPDEVEQVYQKMWNTFDTRNRVYKDEAMQYFAIILKREISLLEFMVATDKDLQNIYLAEAKRLPPEALIQKCHDKRVHLQARAAGFLEVSGAGRYINEEADPLGEKLPDKDEADFSVDELLRAKHRRNTVGFLHRTAADFVRKKTGNSTIYSQNQLRNRTTDGRIS
ncbi:hypothetical protein ABVK25_011991 [Lepraria finkii]|uniref:Nephrocystin 3-like N-terminal domain-containing protein n=1 Tax=Lepraria finkii TaxID=1340010 RepID=A0ABR4ALB8_9LECA